MSDTQQRDNAGELFRNEKKGNNERAPDYRGPGMVNGVELEISAWMKEAKSGKKYMSLSFGPPYKKTGVAPSIQAAANESQTGDEMPF